MEVPPADGAATVDGEAGVALGGAPAAALGAVALATNAAVSHPSATANSTDTTSVIDTLVPPRRRAG